jgi:hypothetical protein
MPYQSSLQLVAARAVVERDTHKPRPPLTFIVLMIIGILLIVVSIVALLTGHGAGTIPDPSVWV